MRKALLGTVVGTLVLSALPAQAGGFVGASYGTTDWEATVQNQSFDADDSSWKLWGGFGETFFGFEAGWVDFGTFDYSDAGGNRAVADASAWDAFIYGRIPIKFFEVFGKLGYSYWDLDQVATVSGAGTFSVNDSDFDFVWGAGIGFNFGKHIGIRLEYEDFDIGDDSTELATLGVILRL